MLPGKNEPSFFPVLYRKVADASEIWLADGPSDRLRTHLKKRAIEPLVIFTGRPDDRGPLPGKSVLSLRHSLARMHPEEIFRILLEVFVDFPAKKVLSFESVIGEALISRHRDILGPRARIMARRDTSQRIGARASSEESLGFVESIRHDGGAIVIRGWCMDKVTCKPIRDLRFFVRDREIPVHLTWSARPLEMAGLDRGFGECGFVAYSFSPSQNARIDEFAVMGRDRHGLAFAVPLDFNRPDERRILLAKKRSGFFGGIKLCVSDPGSGKAWIFGWVANRMSAIRSIRLSMAGSALRNVRLFDPFDPTVPAFVSAEDPEIARCFTAIVPIRPSSKMVAPDIEALLKNGKVARGKFKPARLSGKAPPGPFSSHPATDASLRSSEDELGTFFRKNGTIRFEPHGKPSLSIVLVLHNKAGVTYRALRSLEKDAPKNSEVIIIDNASTDRTARLLRQVRGAHVFRNPRNLHFILAANQGAERSRGRFLLFLNNDCEVLPGAIRAALARAATSPKIGVVGGKLLNPDRTLQEAGFGFRADGLCFSYGYGENPESPEYSFVRRVVACTGAFLLTRRDLFMQLGGFSEKFLPAFFEDLDYCLRANLAGYDVVYEPAASLIHSSHASKKSDFEYLRSVFESQGRFRELWAKELVRRPEYSGTHTLKSRRVLVIARKLFPRPASARALAAMIRSIENRDTQVTVFPLESDCPAWTEVRKSFSDTIEVIRNGSAAGLELFLSRRDPGFDETHFASRALDSLGWVDPSIRSRAGHLTPHSASW